MKGHAIKCLLSFASKACDKFQCLNGHMITLSLLMRCIDDTSNSSASATTAASRDLATVCITFNIWSACAVLLVYAYWCLPARSACVALVLVIHFLYFEVS
jgi:hypothetical protein